MTTIRVGGTIAAPPESIFAYVTDYKLAPLFIDGLQTLTPAGEPTSEAGARFDAEMRIGPKSFQATIEIAAYEENCLVTWSASSGEQRSLTFKLKPDGLGTQVVLEISYERPGGLTGSLLAPIIEETVRSRAHASLRRLRDHMT
jgi:uncharacterized membrane protein